MVILVRWTYVIVLTVVTINVDRLERRVTTYGVVIKLRYVVNYIVIIRHTISLIS